MAGALLPPKLLAVVSKLATLIAIGLLTRVAFESSKMPGIDDFARLGTLVPCPAWVHMNKDCRMHPTGVLITIGYPSERIVGLGEDGVEAYREFPRRPHNYGPRRSWVVMGALSTLVGLFFVVRGHLRRRAKLRDAPMPRDEATNTWMRRQLDDAIALSVVVLGCTPIAIWAVLAG
jgi:hypothetical protein